MFFRGDCFANDPPYWSDDMTIKNDPETLAAARRGAGLTPPEDRKPSDLLGCSMFLYSGDRVGKVESADDAAGTLTVRFDPV